MSLYRYLTMNVNDGCSAHSGQSALEIVWRGKTRIGTARRAYRHQLPKSSAIEKLASVARDTSIEYSAPRCHLRISYAKETLMLALVLLNVCVAKAKSKSDPRASAARLLKAGRVLDVK